MQILKEKSLYLEKLAKQGSFPEIADLKETELPNITIPNTVSVKIKDTKNQKIISKKINYNLKNLNKEYKIYIKLASFSSNKNAEIMKKKVSYIDKVKIYKIYKMNKTLYQVKAGPFSSVEKVDVLHSLLLQKGMQGAKIIIE